MTERTKKDITILIGRELKEARRLFKIGSYAEASAHWQRVGKLTQWLAQGRWPGPDGGAATASRAA
jgi:hypothetical protein